MKTKFVKIKCMAKNCDIKIEIKLKRTWYLENNKRVYTYIRDNLLSFCNFHTEEFKNALAEMKIKIHKDIINKQLKEEINNQVNKELNKYKEN
ncbi:hypothetical protein [Spiroplasma endosymbiont of Polydrusus pterygomalis]|uniref:hypothetical protein n=1 Tax=Spiroplasma endosymbiont of Polydrusus pterygomalis TaxID=3139327 RepID=UPI003CCB255D